MVAQQRGYTCIFVCPDKVSEDQRNVLKAYGAEVVVCPTAVAPAHPDSYYSVSNRLAQEIPGAFKPDQYSNPNGPLSHYETTGPEIWRDTDGKITHFVAGVGTGGTISGVGKYLKEVSDGRVQVIGADPEGSVYSGGTGRPYFVEGVGEDFWPDAYDPDVPHEIIAVSDADSFAMTRRLAREEGILVGGSSGMAVVAALKAAESAGPDDVFVVLLPDGGRGYLGKIFNDKWLRAYGFGNAPKGDTVAEVLAAKADRTPPLVYVHPNDTVRDAIDKMTETGVSQLLVLSAEPPVVLGEVVGALHEQELLELVFSGKVKLSDQAAGSVGASWPLAGVTAPGATARTGFTDASAMLVTDGGKALGVITRSDLLTYLSS
jgi:cystathionine beta-synthase